MLLNITKERRKKMAKPKYDPNTFPELAEGYAREGMIDIEIAAKLGISEASFYLYMNKYSEFSEAVKEGKKPANYKVEKALLKRALGFEYIEKHTEVRTDEKGNTKPVVVKHVTKYHPPDTGAAVFWLINRMPELWRDKKELTHSGRIGTYQEYNDDELKAKKTELDKKLAEIDKMDETSKE